MYLVRIFVHRVWFCSGFSRLHSQETMARLFSEDFWRSQVQTYAPPRCMSSAAFWWSSSMSSEVFLIWSNRTPSHSRSTFIAA